MSGSGSLIPVVMTAAGAQPATPADLRALLVSIAQGLAPGLSTELPGGLIEDMASTGTGGTVVADLARVELINSLTPYGANEFLLTQLGTIYGVPVNQQAFPNAIVVFSGTANFPIQSGFTVSDGTYQYVVQLGGIVGSTGTSDPILVVCTVQGQFAIPANSINQITTSLPGGISLTVTNPQAGAGGSVAQTPAQYRAAVLQAGLVAAQGMPAYLKTLLSNIPGVPLNLISIRQQAGGWQVIVGGSGDPIAIGNAIYEGLFDISNLAIATLNVVHITNASSGLVTTDVNHGFSDGQTITITGVVGMTGVNGVLATVTVLNKNAFLISINTTGSGSYVSGGVITPNFHNTSVSINSYPDSYNIPYLVPFVQITSLVISWQTTSPNLVSPIGVAQVVQPAIAAYISNLPIGAPISLLELRTTFISATEGLIEESSILVLQFVVVIGGGSVAPAVGEELIYGDPLSYFLCPAANVELVAI